jgi:hypothetical protein
VSNRALFVIGNGLSQGFDPRLATAAITERVLARLGPDHTAILEEVSELAAPDVPDLAPIGVDRGGFEALAGPLDRLSEALTAIERLVQDRSQPAILAGLRAASEALRLGYLRVVGTVLDEVDTCCHEPAADDARRDSWQAVDEFAAALIDLRMPVFTLNYDSLLMSAMLERSGFVYDGFRGRTLNLPLDPWNEPLLYHLHGSVGWFQSSDGAVGKRRLDEVRAKGILRQWADGETENGYPSVLLGDLKSRLTREYPFLIMYEELYRQLEGASLVVAGGYSFGDRPLNHAMASFLARNTQRRIRVWNQHVDKERYLQRLRSHLPDTETISDNQVEVDEVMLPDASSVRRLAEELLSE